MIRTEDEDYIEFHSEKFEKILDTEYMCDVPYKIDLKKYNEVMEKYLNPGPSRRDLKSKIDTIVISFEKYLPVESENYLTCNLYVWRTSRVYAGNDDECDYNCFLFSNDCDEDKTPETVVTEFEQCLRDVLDCIICLNEVAAKQYIKDVNEAIEEKQKEIETFKDIIEKKQTDDNE